MLVVGAKLLGQASTETVASITKSDCLARNELFSPTIQANLLLPCFNNGTNTLISDVFPLLERQSIKSSF